MPFLIPVAAAAASAITAGAAAAAGTGKVNPKDLPPAYRPDPNQYNYGGEGLEFFRKGGSYKVGRDDQTIADQRDLVKQLQMSARGEGPSAAQGILQKGRDASIAAGQSLAGSARGPGLAAAQMAGINAGSRAMGEAANQATILRAQEQQAAIDSLGNVLGGMRGAYNNEESRRQEMEKFYMSLGQSREEAALNARMQLEHERAGAYRDWATQKTGILRGNAEMDARFVGGIGKAFSDLGAQSADMMSGGGKGPK